MIPAFEWVKTVHALDRMATMVSAGKTLQFYLRHKIA
jgi:hypothetical protein